MEYGEHRGRGNQGRFREEKDPSEADLLKKKSQPPEQGNINGISLFKKTIYCTKFLSTRHIKAGKQRRT